MRFEFLRARAIDGITGVFQHNQMDLRGLAALGGRIFQTLAQPEHGEREPLELYGISRLLNRRGEWSKARTVYERCLAAGLPEPIARRAKHEAARLAKRERDFGQAIGFWHGLANPPRPSFEALEQLAIYHEHRDRDFREAIRVTRLAVAELRRSGPLGGLRPEPHEDLLARFRRRLARLERKTNQTSVACKG